MILVPYIYHYVILVFPGKPQLSDVLIKVLFFGGGGGGGGAPIEICPKDADLLSN